jgi:hypothetical protein
MRRARLTTVAAGLAAAALLVTGVGAAAISPAYNVAGIEVAVTPTQGTFIGSGTGSGGDKLVWKAIVDHTGLSPNATITGGSFAAISHGDGLSTLTGTFTGGTVTLVEPGLPCGNQVYDVDGTLDLASGDAVGTGTFDVQLTHHRISLFGRCITFAATVRGTLATSF